MVWGVVLTLVAVCSALAALLAAWLSRREIANRAGRTILAGFLPTAVIVAVVTVWHVIVIRERIEQPQEEFMSPLLFLAYGFPFVLLNLVANLFAASGYARRQ